MRAPLVLLAVAGCYHPSVPAGAPCDDDTACPADQRCVAGTCGGTLSASDASIDAVPIDAVPLCLTWQPRHFDPCGLPPPMGDLYLTAALSGFSWDTDKPELKGKMNTTLDVATMVMAQQDGPELLVASVDNFTLETGATLDVSGARALLIAVWGTASIDGSIDADASFLSAGPGGGAVASAPGCGGGPTGNFGAAGSPATGGGGGAFQGDGGGGGNSGGANGVGLAPPAIIRGGCAGGGGGAGSGAAATRGAGGGAIQISARLAIDVGATASIHAAGGGGGPGRLALGGGGAGGAGGYVGLDAPVVTIAGTITANGGSGGGGASDVADGATGADGRTDELPAAGGSGATTSNVGTCGRGGDGSAGGTLAGADGGSSTGCGGAGAGGGAGYILIWSPALDVTGTVSPPVTGGP